MILTPKEKLKELIIKFQHPPSALEHTECECLHIDIAKECTLIAVNEIISCGVRNDYYWDKKLGRYLSFEEYYIEVKKQLEKR